MIYAVEYYNTKYSVDFTAHTRETRATENVPRDALVYPEMCHTLLRTALQHGLFSMRDRPVVITARVGSEYAVSFIVVLSDANNITVLSILSHPFTHYYIYYTVRNRINLYSLVLPQVSVKQAEVLRNRQAEIKPPKSFKKTGVPKQRLNYRKGSKEYFKNELESYSTTHNYKRKL